MNINDYLDLLEIEKPKKLDYLFLAELQNKHILSVPFENLDIQANIPILLEPEHLYEKIVVNKRGGFCYELNFLFYTLLKNLGFDVIMSSASFFHADINKFAPPFDHLALIVKLDKCYLTDVGFGDTCPRVKAEVVSHELGPSEGATLHYF